MKIPIEVARILESAGYIQDSTDTEEIHDFSNSCSGAYLPSGEWLCPSALVDVAVAAFEAGRGAR